MAEEEQGRYLEMNIPIHYAQIMLASELMTDENDRQQYFDVMRGRFSLTQFVRPLAVVGWKDYWIHVANTVAEYSIQFKKADTFLFFAAVVLCKYGGRMPTNALQVRAFFEVGRKKTAVTLLACGFYERAGLGPGPDSHYMKCGSYAIAKHCPWIKKNHGAHAYKMNHHIPREPGIRAK